jgi:hypothetical protein
MISLKSYFYSSTSLRCLFFYFSYSQSIRAKQSVSNIRIWANGDYLPLVRKSSFLTHSSPFSVSYALSIRESQLMIMFSSFFGCSLVIRMGPGIGNLPFILIRSFKSLSIFKYLYTEISFVFSLILQC